MSPETLTREEPAEQEVAREPDRDEGMVDAFFPGEAKVADAARRSLDGHRRGIRRLWPFLGPAFVASVAYIDPGNFATNIAGGPSSATDCCGWCWPPT